MSYEQHRGKSIDDLLTEIDAAWQRLLTTMMAEPETAYTEKHDPAGWTALDHLAHVTAWERSVLFPLLGRTRHEGLGITEAEFLMDFDPCNQIIREQTAGDSYDTVMRNARDVHAELVDTVSRASIDDLWRPAREMASDQREQERDVPFMEILMSDGCEHFDEHRVYIERILAS